MCLLKHENLTLFSRKDIIATGQNHHQFHTFKDHSEIIQEIKSLRFFDLQGIISTFYNCGNNIQILIASRNHNSRQIKVLFCMLKAPSKRLSQTLPSSTWEAHTRHKTPYLTGSQNENSNS